jgi:hypothetical protein
MKLNGREIKNWEIDGVDSSDYPDFCDAYFSYAEYEDGTPLTDDELEGLSYNYADVLNEAAMEDCISSGSDYEYDMDR